jgi:ferredoxin
MALREIIEIDEKRCDGCGACQTGCPEGALRVIDGKARLVGESLCDGLGACIGECPRGAIKVTKREAEPYDEAKVMEGISHFGSATVAAHLEHLASHGQDSLEAQALAWLASHGQKDPREGRAASSAGCGGGCPGSASRRFAPHAAATDAARIMGGPGPSSGGQAQTATAPVSSALGHWPIQLCLVNPAAPQYASARILVAADCTAFAMGAFHPALLAGKSLVIACPKLDDREGYAEKLARLIKGAASLEVAIMEVPCCGGLLKLMLEARELAGVNKNIEVSVIGVEGGIVAKNTA